MTVEQRIEAMREFCGRHDFKLSTFTASQREPENGLVVTARGVKVRAVSTDSMEVVVARMEQALTALGAARSDAYLHEPHRWMGRIG